MSNGELILPTHLRKPKIPTSQTNDYQRVLDIYQHNEKILNQRNQEMVLLLAFLLDKLGGEVEFDSSKIEDFKHMAIRTSFDEETKKITISLVGSTEETPKTES